LLVENARLESLYKNDPLIRTSADSLTLFDLAVEASRERANKVTRLEIYIPLKWDVELLKKMLSGDGSRTVKVYYNREQGSVKAELQVYGAQTPMGITTLSKWTRDFFITLLRVAFSIIKTITSMEGVQGYLPDPLWDPYFIEKLNEIIMKLDRVAR
ncbi:MAG: hypothetical protein F7C81_02740, partial [Desulfurococcales archaeon]|nr:hypothetical protein [Desulfurococcales archaeon]